MQIETIATLDLGNNDSLSVSIVRESDGTYTATTFSASKTFKTYAGARRWLASRGF